MEPGSAVGPGAGGDAKALRQLVGDFGGIKIPDVQRHDRGPDRGGEIPVDRYPRQIPDRLVKPAGQGVLMGVDVRNAGFRQEVQSGAQSRQAVAVEGPGL